MHGEIEAALGSAITSTQSLTGGDVAQAYRVTLDDDRVVFAKTRPGASPDFFATEALGLAALNDAQQLLVPAVLLVGVNEPLLVLEWIEESGSRPASDRAFGAALARLHRTGTDCFGRADKRTTGSRGLPNEPSASWTDFYAVNRLLPLAKIARDESALPKSTIDMLESIALRLADFGGADEDPARLHGDLWAGNRVVDDLGQSWLIDPAAHGGHREFDLAMMRLFGGWQQDVFEGYEDEWPLADGWRDRVALHQLAPLAVHAIKFGGSYVAATTQAAHHYA